MLTTYTHFFFAAYLRGVFGMRDVLTVNFADNPGQAALTMARTYVGEAVNDEFFRSVA